MQAAFTPIAIGLASAVQQPYGQYTANQLLSKSSTGSGSMVTSQQT
jgi:hypothetical protein